MMIMIILKQSRATIGPKSRDFLRELGQRLMMVTGKARSCTFLLQRISIAIQVDGTIGGDLQDLENDLARIEVWEPSG